MKAGAGCADGYQSTVEVRQGRVIQTGGSCASGRKAVEILQTIPQTPPLSNSMGGGFVVRMPPAVHAWPGGHLGEDNFEGPWLRNRILEGLDKEAHSAHPVGALKDLGPPSKLKIWVYAVEGMKQMDMTSQNDPYCSCSIDHKEIFKTPTHENAGRNCTWNHGPEEVEYAGQEEIDFCVMDDNTVMDSKAGTARLHGYMFTKRGYEGELPLIDPHGKAHGVVKLKIECVR